MKVRVTSLQRELSEKLNRLLNSNSKEIAMKSNAKKSVKKSLKPSTKTAARKHNGLLKGLREQKLAPIVGGLLKPKVKGVRKREFLPYKSGSAIQALFMKLVPGKPVEQKTLFAAAPKGKTAYAKAAVNRIAKHGIVSGKWNVKVAGTKIQLQTKKGFKMPAAKAS